MKSSIVGDIDLTSEPLLGAKFDEFNTRVSVLEAGDATTGGSGATDAYPTGVASYRREKKFAFPNITYAISGDIRKLKTIIVQRSLVVDQGTFDGLRIVDTDKEISDFARSASTADIEFSAGKAGLAYETTYDILKVVWNGGEGQEPIDDLDAAAYLANPAGTALLSFTTPTQFNVPSAPAAGLIVYNERDAQTADEADAHCGLKVHAPLTDAGAAQTWGAAVVEWVQASLQRDFGGTVGVKNIPFKRLLTDTELAQVDATSTPTNRGFVIIEANGLKAGAAYTWVENKIKTLEGKKTTTGSVAFSAGNESGDLTTLTSVSLTVSASDPYDGKHVKVSLNFTQPSTIVTLKNFTLKRKKSTDGAYTDVVVQRGLEVQSDDYHLAGAHTAIVEPSLKVKPSTTYNLELTLRTRTNTTTRVITATFTTDADGNIVQDTAAPGPVGLNTPKLWFKRGKLHMRMSMSGLTNINSLATVEASIGTGFASLNMDNLDTDTAAGANVFYQTGRDDCNIELPVSLKQARRIFGDVQLDGFFRLTNSVGQTTSSVSNLLSLLSGLTDYSPNSGGSNELWNGDFTNDDGVTSTTVGNWEQWRITTGSFLAVDTGTTRGRWDQTNHLIFWHQNDSSTNKAYFLQNLFQTLIFGDFHSFSFFLSSNSSITANFDLFIGVILDLTGTWTINGTTTVSGSSGAALSELVAGAEVSINNEVRTVLNVANNNSFTVTVAFAGSTSGTVHAAVPMSNVVQLGSQSYTSTEKYVEATVQIDASLATNFNGQDLLLMLRSSTTIGTGGPYLQISRFMMVIGKTPVQFDRKNIKERNVNTSGLTAGAPVASEDLSVVPTGGIGGDQQKGSGAFGDIPPAGGFLIE